MHEFIARGSFEPNLRRMNELIKARRDAMLAALEQAPPGRDVDPARGRLLRLARVPSGTNCAEVLERAKGVTAVLGTEFSAPANCVRLAYSYASPDEIEAGVERLAAAM